MNIIPQVIEKMSTFDENTNGTYTHSWLSHEGLPDDTVYFPSSTFGIDANRTFEYVILLCNVVHHFDSMVSLYVFSSLVIIIKVIFVFLFQVFGACSFL